MARHILHPDQMEQVKNNIVKSTCDYLVDNPKIKSLILGVSGGADSALVAALCDEVRYNMAHCYNNRTINLVFRSLPISTNTPEEIDRSNWILSSFQGDMKEIDLYQEFRSLLESCGSEEDQQQDTNSFERKVRVGNIKARLRMIYLYNLAAIHEGMVMSTDNYTEFLLGFWTLHGDVGDFGMIQNLWKTEVFMMLDYLIDNCIETGNTYLASALTACRTAVPTDGLGITSSDLDQFEDVNSYEEVDKIFEEILTLGYANVIKNGGRIPKVLSMHERTHFKRENPFNLTRDLIIKNI